MQQNNKNFIFGSTQQLIKINNTVLSVWRKILCQTPNAIIMLICNGFHNEELKNYYQQKLEESGINKNQIFLFANSDHNEYILGIQQIDLMLGTFPSSGMTTAIEALLLDTPTLTINGEIMTSRLTANCLANICANDFICNNQKDYIKKAIFFANNLEKLNVLKFGLNEKVRQSPLCDEALFAKHFENKMWQVWNNFVAN